MLNVDIETIHAEIQASEEELRSGAGPATVIVARRVPQLLAVIASLNKRLERRQPEPTGPWRWEVQVLTGPHCWEIAATEAFVASCCAQHLGERVAGSITADTPRPWRVLVWPADAGEYTPAEATAKVTSSGIELAAMIRRDQLAIDSAAAAGGA